MKIQVKLRQGHPHRVMRARLADNQVIEIGEAGVELEASQLSAEMRGCGWFEQKAVKAKASTQSREDATGDSGAAETNTSAEDPAADAGAGELPPPVGVDVKPVVAKAASSRRAPNGKPAASKAAPKPKAKSAAKPKATAKKGK